MRLVLFLLVMLPLLRPAESRADDASFRTSDGVRLHVIQAGPANAGTIVFVPGWTMPAWIFQAQIRAFAQSYRVVALDPRGQGDSDIAPGGYDYMRRGQDIAELIQALGNPQVVLVGWSLGVLDSLSYIQQYGDGRIAGLVLIDNSIGEDPPPVASRLPAVRGPRLAREVQVQRFVAGMFRVSPGQEYLARLTEAALRTPPEAAAQLASYTAPRSFWRDAVYAVRHPVLYVVRPRFAAQAENLAAKHPYAQIEVFRDAGHALFVDEAVRFNTLLAGFVRRIWS